MPRAGAPRVLRLIDTAGRPLQGSLSEPRWEPRGDGLFFTRQWGGTRNIWRAFPDPQDTHRYPTWRALPLTQFESPAFASSAVPIRGARSLLLVSNAPNPRGAAQILQFELVGAVLRPLTNFENGAFDPAPSPDGETVAFAATQSGATAIYLQSLRGGAPRRLVADARRPTWQDERTLLVESATGERIFRVPLGEGSRPTLLGKGQHISTTHDGSLLALSAASGASAPSQLYLLAGDGSGQRALIGTQNAQRPALSPDGRTLAFDAPLPGTTSPRALWILPLQSESAAPREFPRPSPRRRIVENPQIAESTRPVQPQTTRVDAPIAQITGVQSTLSGAILILGNIGGQNTRATLEVGAGAAPTRWRAIPLSTSRAAGTPLAQWTPPASARELWTLRLTVSSASGATQSLFSVRLPLNARFPVAAPPPRPTPVPSAFPRGGPLPPALLPNLPAPPSSSQLPSPAPLPPSLPRPTATPRPVPAPPSTPSAPSPVTPPSPRRDAATFNVSGTPATMKAGQKANVTFWALNQGTQGWATAGRGAVRLVARWVDLEGGNRHNWTRHWLRSPVAPGQRTRWDFALVAPSRPGRYKLIYGLVRLRGEKVQEPAYNAPQNSWPDEFAAIAFAVTVTR